MMDTKTVAVGGHESPTVSTSGTAPRKPKRRGKPRAKLSSLDVSQIHVWTQVDPKTIRRWARGEAVKPVTHRRLSAAAARRGIDVA